MAKLSLNPNSLKISSFLHLMLKRDPAPNTAGAVYLMFPYFSLSFIQQSELF
jgi:hypothetical protein